MSEIIINEQVPEGGILELTTSRINGEINYFIIKIDETINLLITGTEHEHVKLYERVSMFGNHYIPIRVRPLDFEANGFTHGAFVKYKINDKLKIIVKGKGGTNLFILIDFTEKNG